MTKVDSGLETVIRLILPVVGDKLYYDEEIKDSDLPLQIFQAASFYGLKYGVYLGVGYKLLDAISII